MSTAVPVSSVPVTVRTIIRYLNFIYHTKFNILDTKFSTSKVTVGTKFKFNKFRFTSSYYVLVVLVALTTELLVHDSPGYYM
eukprot:SAG31_NODE_806_length_11957_cov_2.232670_13_plen_82_part_00